MKQTNTLVQVVTPYTGVWIEIIAALNTMIAITVTPYTGVWIEIALSGYVW